MHMPLCLSEQHASDRVRGFVLFSTLVFLQIFSLMSVFGLMRVSESLKASDAFLQRERLVGVSRGILTQIEQRVESRQPVCMIPRTSAVLLAAMPLNWWKTHTCSGNFGMIRYYYAVELEDLDVCAHSDKSINNQMLAIQYYRLTLLVLSGLRDETRYYLQSTIALEGNQRVSCSSGLRQIRLGRQMWREI